MLEIFLHGIHLHHGVGNRGTCSKDYATASGQLVQITALHIKVAGLLCFSLADTAHVPHFCVCGQVLIIMCLVHEQPIDTQFLKCHNIVFATLIVKFIQLGLQHFSGAFHLLDGKVVPTALLQITDAVQDLAQLFLQNGSLPFQRHRDFFQLGMPDNDGIIIAGGNPTTEFLAVFGLKVFLCGHQNIGRWVKLEILGGPLLG